MQIITDEQGNMVLDVAQGSDNLRDTFNSNNADISTSNDVMAQNFSDNADDITDKVSDIEGSLNANKGGFSSWAESIGNSLRSAWDSAREWLGRIIDKIGEVMSSIRGVASSAISGGIGSAIGGAVGGRTFSSISTYSAIPQMEFPGYATGQVIPTSMKKHLAWLGDNNHETEVVSPLSTMKQVNKEAILEVLSELGITGGNGRSTGGETFVFQVDGKTFFEITRGEAQKYFSRTGRVPYPT